MYVLKAYILKIPEKVVKINIFLVYKILRDINLKKVGSLQFFRTGT